MSNYNSPGETARRAEQQRARQRAYQEQQRRRTAKNNLARVNKEMNDSMANKRAQRGAVSRDPDETSAAPRRRGWWSLGSTK